MAKTMPFPPAKKGAAPMPKKGMPMPFPPAKKGGK